jgi:hypothetical protein
VLQDFQRDHGIFASGTIRPGDETEAALNTALPENEKSGGQYLWRTVQDGKVRSGF